jgi:N-acetylated-alpha-linked acidic dipeptidase
LKDFLISVAADVPDPAGGSVLERARERLQQSQPKLADENILGSGSPADAKRQEIEVGNLGGGTDFIGFINHLGIPSTDFMFDGDYGVYHSIFDNHRWMKKFGDPEFKYHVAAAQFLGLEILRFADAEILPLDYGNYGQAITGYLSELRRNLLTRGWEGKVTLDSAVQAAQELASAGRSLRDQCESLLKQDSPGTDFYRINRNLVRAEQGFLLPAGLPGRPWYKHQACTAATMRHCCQASSTALILVTSGRLKIR